MDNIVYVNINELKPHPKNQELFDDITGEKWDRFKCSIYENGILSPLTITEDNIIINGHQRFRAINELEKEHTDGQRFEQVPCVIKKYENDNAMLVDLIELNIEQRAITKMNPVKFAKCIELIKNVYSITRGGDHKSQEAKESNETKFSLKDLAKKFGKTEQYLNKLQKLLKLIPEIQDSVQFVSDDSKIKKKLSVNKALLLVDKSEEFQKNFIVKNTINEIKKMKIADLETKIKEFTNTYIDNAQN